MKTRDPQTKILSRPEALAKRGKLRQLGKRVVFTNGCFDIVHAGHASTMAFAKGQGDVLIVGLNSDASVRRLKGDRRPVVAERHRAALIAALEAVDYVVLFDETEVDTLVGELKPDVLVKGMDRAGNIVGREHVEAYGGRVVAAPLVEGLSTSGIIARVLEAYR
jgi:D-beta-D-heptose 7-phosphate kinase/D-beta-D-heptose 1-phosphate adenosyltransferase